MGVSFVEGFDWAGSAAAISEKWSVGNSGTGLTLETGRDGVGQCLRWASAQVTTAIWRQLPRSMADGQDHRFMVGFAFRISAYPSGDISNIIGLYGDTDDGRQAGVGISPAGVIGWVRNGGVGQRPFLSHPEPISLNVWHHFMCEVQIEDTGASSMTYDLYLDGKIVSMRSAISVRTIDTDPVIDMRIGPTSAMGTVDIDDFWMMVHDDGVAPTSLLGDVVVSTIHPDGDGNTSAWTRNTGTNDWEMVDEAAGVDHDGNTTYVSSQTAGQQSLFTFGAVNAAADSVVSALAINYVSSKEAALGGPGFHAVKRTGTTTVVDDSFVMQSGQDDYVTAQKIWITDGEDAAWTETTINSSEFGMEVED